MALPDWLKPGRGLPAAVRTSLITIFAVLSLGVAMEYFGLYEGVRDVMSAKVTVGERADGIIPLTVTPRLTNYQDEGVLYEVDGGPCKVFRWILLDSNGEFVQSQADPECPDVTMEQYIKPGHYLEQEFTLEIRERRLRAGESYSLQMRFWGEDLRVAVPGLAE